MDDYTLRAPSPQKAGSGRLAYDLAFRTPFLWTSAKVGIGMHMPLLSHPDSPPWADAQQGSSFRSRKADSAGLLGDAFLSANSCAQAGRGVTDSMACRRETASKMKVRQVRRVLMDRNGHSSAAAAPKKQPALTRSEGTHRHCGHRFQGRQPSNGTALSSSPCFSN